MRPAGEPWRHECCGVASRRESVRWSQPPRFEPRGEDGNVSVLTLGWLVVALLALLAMASASQVHMDRARLASLADEVALVAASAAAAHGDSPGEDSRSGGGADETAMVGAVHDWLAGDARPWVGEVAVVAVTGAADGTVTVQLGRTVTPLFELEALGPFNVGIDLAVEGRSRVG